jgi:nitric-oxide synthase
MKDKEYYLNEATEFISRFYEESCLNGLKYRIDAITAEINQTGIWTPTSEELSFGGKLAWRNSNRCIGRLFYNSLHVIDRRGLLTEHEVFMSLTDHLRMATNKGNIKSILTVFESSVSENSVRIWNSKLVRYAGYKLDDSIIGDPQEVEFTKVCMDLGWQGKGTQFDVLPIVIQIGNRPPKWFELPSDTVLEVKIEHPELTWFEELNLKWYAVPVITDMAFRIGGIEFNAAPFNGWFMETEIGSRNFGDKNRYNLLPILAKQMNLDTRSNLNLWKDKVLLELNRAVLYSFRKARVTITDHHTASKQFMRFCKKEKSKGREVMADWTWIVPPMGASATEVFYNSWENKVIDPNFYYQTSPWNTKIREEKMGCPFHIDSLHLRMPSL